VAMPTDIISTTRPSTTSTRLPTLTPTFSGLPLPRRLPDISIAVDMVRLTGLAWHILGHSIIWLLCAPPGALR
jgi:hypothetical protein